MNETQAGIESILQSYFSFIPSEYWAVISLILAIAIIIITFVGRLTNAIVGVHALATKVFGANQKTPNIETDSARVLRQVWLRDIQTSDVRPMPEEHVGIPIISFINMKGGVGKTTLSGNIGAHFREKGARVLFIDFDYQGTMSLMIASTAGVDRVENSSFRLLQNSSYQDVAPFIRQFDSLPNIGLLAAHYILFRDEMELFANWAADKTDYDIRFALKEIVQSSACARDWDVVIVDCGPRFTTSTINALCASTHVVIPAILDEPSAQAVGYLSKEFEAHRSELFPYLRLLGVIPTMIAQDPKNAKKPRFNLVEEEQLLAIEDALDLTWGDGDYVLRAARIPKRAQVSKNADKLAYTIDDEAKRIFGRAGNILMRRLADEGFRITRQN